MLVSIFFIVSYNIIEISHNYSVILAFGLIM